MNKENSQYIYFKRKKINKIELMQMKKIKLQILKMEMKYKIQIFHNN